MKENKNPMPGLVLTSDQIEELAKFAKEDGQPKYCITHSTIPAFVAEDGSNVPEYTGLIAYSESEDHGVLQLDGDSSQSGTPSVTLAQEILSFIDSQRATDCDESCEMCRAGTHQQDFIRKLANLIGERVQEQGMQIR